MNSTKGVIGIIVCTLLWSSTVQATTVTKKVQYYYSPTFYYNGELRNLESSVIMIDGTTYVPARSFSNAVGLNLDWNTGDNTLTVDGASPSRLSIDAELQAKDYEIASLKKELMNLQQQGNTAIRTIGSRNNHYEQTEGTDILGTELTDTAEDLETEYADYFEDIDLDFSVKLASSKLKVTITYDKTSDNKVFNKLSSREIKLFAQEVCEMVRNHHDKIAIEGVIKYTDTNTTKYYFEYSKKDKLTYGMDKEDILYEEVTASEILSLLKDVTTLTIDDYTGSIAISKMETDVNESRERIKLNVYLELTEDMKNALNANTGYDNDSNLKSCLRDFSRRINRETDYEDIQVYVYNGSNLIGYYDYEENELKLYSI